MVCPYEDKAESVMAKAEDDNELLTVRELRDRYQLLEFEAHVPRLDPLRVPEQLRYLIPYAQIWGVADDTLRSVMLTRASYESRADLKRVVYAADDLLDDWLAGPEADEASPSNEYIAFSAMRMAADSVES